MCHYRLLLYTVQRNRHRINVWMDISNDQIKMERKKREANKSIERIIIKKEKKDPNI